MSWQKRIDCTEPNNNKPSKENQVRRDELGDLLHKNLKNFTLGDIGKLFSLAVPICTCVASGIATYHGAETSAPATVTRPMKVLDALITQTESQREKSTPEQKRTSELIKCGKLIVAQVSENDDDASTKIAFQKCVMASRRQKSTDREPIKMAPF